MPDPLRSAAKVLMVEGDDEERLVKALLKTLGITGVDVQNARGKDNFKRELFSVFNTPREGDLEIIGIIRDAEGSASRVFQSTTHIFKRLSEKLNLPGLTTPARPEVFSQGTPRVGVFIMPGNAERGMLEDLCLKSVEKHPAMKCVETFRDCIKTLKPPPKVPAKACAQAFLAAMPEIVRCVGEGAEKKYWDLDSEAFSALQSFLETLR